MESEKHRTAILRLENVVKYLSGKKILHEVSFEVQEGEIYGFLWPNGAGKTTTMKCILGFITPESGTIEMFWKQGFTKDIRQHIGFMPENTYLYKYLKGREFLEFNAGFFGIVWKQAKEKIDSLLERVGLMEAKESYLYTYSKGMLQRIGIAQSLINDPKLLFLDEPMSWLDPLGRKMVKDILVELKKQGTTIFFNTHILADVESICDKFSIIHKGNIIVSSMKVKDLTKPLEDFFIESLEKKQEVLV